MNNYLKGFLVISAILFSSPVVYAEVEIPDYDAAIQATTPAKKEEVRVEEIKPAETQPAVAESEPVKTETAATVAVSQAEAVSVPGPEPEKTSVSDKLIGSTFKTLAKGFVKVVNLDNIKEKHIAKLQNQSEEKFRKQFNKAYEVLKDMPEPLRKQYKITENTSKEQIIQNLESLNKARMYKLIDDIPDWVIAKHFRAYLNKTSQEVEKSNVVVKIKNLWEGWISQADK